MFRMKVFFVIFLFTVAFAENAVETPTTLPPLDSSDAVTRAQSGDLAIDAVTDDAAGTLKGMLTEQIKKLKSAFAKALKKIAIITQRAQNVPTFITENVPHVASKLFEKFEESMSSLIGPLYDAINKGGAIADAGLIQAIGLMDKLHKCAVEEEKTDKILGPITREIFHCIDERIRRCELLTDKLNSELAKIGVIEDDMPQQVQKCFERGESDQKGYLDIFTCITTWSGEWATKAVVVASKLSAQGTQSGNMFLKAAAEVANCANDKAHEAIKKYAAIGVDTDKCLKQFAINKAVSVCN